MTGLEGVVAQSKPSPDGLDGEMLRSSMEDSKAYTTGLMFKVIQHKVDQQGKTHEEEKNYLV